MAFTNEQMERYSRHIILQEVGVKGQKKLLNGKVLIIGTGGLGSPAAMYLAAAGVGTIGIVDADEVDLSNLQRQIIHGTADVGKAKVKSAKETMNAMNPDVTVNTYREFVTSENIMDLIKDYPSFADKKLIATASPLPIIVPNGPTTISAIGALIRITNVGFRINFTIFGVIRSTNNSI